MSDKEATARIKINKLLEKAGYRFFSEDGRAVNTQLELGVTLKSTDLDGFGERFPKIHLKTRAMWSNTLGDLFSDEF